MAASARHCSAWPRPSVVCCWRGVQEGRLYECGEQQSIGTSESKRMIGRLFLAWLAANLNQTPATPPLRIAQKPLLGGQAAFLGASSGTVVLDSRRPAKGADDRPTSALWCALSSTMACWTSSCVSEDTSCRANSHACSVCTQSTNGTQIGTEATTPALSEHGKLPVPEMTVGRQTGALGSVSHLLPRICWLVNPVTITLAAKIQLALRLAARCVRQLHITPWRIV